MARRWRRSNRSSPSPTHAHRTSHADLLRARGRDRHCVRQQVLAVEYAETTGGPTSMTPSVPFAGNTRFYWHVKATDPGHESPWSPTLTFVTPAPAAAPPPAPVPPPSSGGQLGPGDQLDLHSVTIVLGAAGIADWPVTSTVTSTTTQDHNFCINHTMLGQLADDAVLRRPEHAARRQPVGVREHRRQMVRRRRGLVSPGPGLQGRDPVEHRLGWLLQLGAAALLVPRPGETFGVMDSTPARLYPDMRTLDQRTNVVLVKWGQ